MTASNYDKSLGYVLQSEGGYVNNPKDPGGATNEGVTQHIYDAYRISKKVTKRPVSQIAPVEVNLIYRLQYWNKIHGDDLPTGLDYAVFDEGVNSGPVTAVKALQTILKVKSDGVYGLVTANAVAANNDIISLINDYNAQRLSFLHRLKTWTYFKKGWSNRVAIVGTNARAMAITSYRI